MAVDPTPLRQVEPLEPSFLAVLRERGIEPILVSGDAELDAINADDVPGLALIDAGAMSQAELGECVRRCSQLRLPVIALVPYDQVADIEPALGIDDFVLGPPRPDELVARAMRVLGRGPSPADDDSLRIGDLVINTANYEVSVKGRKVYLRFKEYELLLLMAATPGRVFTREALLKQIWGYDYLGGTRTVDVHIRRAAQQDRGRGPPVHRDGLAGRLPL